MPLEQAKKQVGSFWSYLYPKKEDIQNQLIDVMPEINANDISATTEEIKAMASSVSKNKTTWQEWFNILPEGRKHLAQLGQQMEGQIITTEGVVKANQQARASALAHNEAIKAQTFSAKAGKVALQALAMAGNMIAMWAISKVISFVAEKIDNLAHSAEHCAERVNELISSYQSALDKANNNAKTVENLASRYEELSKGVNNLGQNVSLTADEYSEYNDIVNQIADMFPTLIQGYTNEGNAILSLKGNVEQLRDAYKEAQQEAYNMLIISGEDSDGNDIITNYHNTISNDNPFLKNDSVAKEYIDIINSFHEAMLTSDEVYNQFYEEMIKSQNLITEYDMSAKQFTKIKKVLDDIGFKSELSDDDKRAINNNTKAYIQTYQAEIDNALSGVRSLANAYLMTNEDYADLDDDAKTAASLIVNSIDTELANGFEEKTDVGAYVAEIVSLIKDNPDVSNALNGLFNTDFSKLSYDDAKAIIDQYINTIAELTERDPIELKATLGFSEYDDNENLVNNVKEKLQDDFDGKVGELTLEELKIAAEQVEVPEGTLLSWDELIAKIEEVKEQSGNAAEIKTFDQAWANSFTSENDKVKELADNLLELAEKGRLTKESFAQTDSTNYFKNLGISADEAILKINKLVDESKQLSSMASQLSSISDALGTKRDDGFVSADTLAGFDVEIRGLDSWDRFQEVLGSTASSYEECQEAANALATEWVNSSDFLAQLTEQNKEYYETQLKAMGIENYEEIISYAQALNEAKDALAQSSLDLSTATEEEIQALIDEGTYSELAQQQIWALYAAKLAEQASSIDSSADCQQFLNLANDANLTAEAIRLLTEMMSIYSGLESGVYSKSGRDREYAYERISQIKSELDALANGEGEGLIIEPTVKLGSKGKSAASSAGSEAADAYVEAFEEELAALEDLRDRGVIDEAEYLQRLRELYTRYFADRKEYLDEFKKYERQYLEGMKSLYDSALSGITKLMDNQINGYNEAKDAAVSALEEERDARLEAIETQKEQLETEQDLIDKRIEAKQEIIDSIQKEIDAMKEVREERQRQLELQKAQYELERMQNQNTILQYSESEGMHYVQDTSGVRDAKDAVDDIESDIKVAKKEKEIKLIEEQIDLLEKQKEAIQDQIDALDKQSEQIEKYYSTLISEQEKYFDSIIKNMEQQKSKWEELAEIEEIAQAYSAIEQVFGDMGYTVQDILNGNEQAFEDFKSRYIAIMSDMNQNTSFQEGLEYASGVAKENFGSIVSDAQSTVQELSQTFSDGTFSQAITQGVSDGIVSAKQELDKMDQLGKDAGDGLLNGWDEKSNLFVEAAKQTAQDAVEAFAEGQDSHSPSEKYKGLASDAVDGLLLGIEENKQSFIDTVRSLAEEGVLAFEEGFSFENSTLNTSFDELKLLIKSVTEALGLGTEGTVGGLLGALEQLSNFSFNEDSIIKQFDNLKTAIDSVTSAISGGGESSGGEGQGGGSAKGNKAGGNGSKGSEGGGGNSLTGAIESIGETVNKVIGEPEAEGDGTVIGEFGSMKTAVNGVTTAIGGGDSESGEGSGGSSEGEGEDNLIGSIVDLGETTQETLGESGGDGVIGRFEELKQPIQEANEHVHGISDGLAAIDGQEVECTIKVNIETTGGLPIGIAHSTGTALDTMNLNSAEYNAKYTGNAHVEGTALVSGNWAVQSDEQNALVGEEGYEIVVRDGRFFTVGNTGAEMFPIKKGDIVFNHEQSVNLLKNGHISGRGKAYADGTVGGGKFLIPDGTIIEPYDPDKDNSNFSKFYKAWNAYYGDVNKNVDEINKKLSQHLAIEHSQNMNEEVNRFVNNSSSIVNNNRNVQPVVHQNVTISCPNVTNESGAENIQKELSTLSLKALQVDW